MTNNEKQLIQEYCRKFKNILDYNPMKGGQVIESNSKYNGFINIGFVKDGNIYTQKGGDAYLFVNPEEPEWRRFKFLSDTNPTSNNIVELPLSISSSRITLYPKYKGTEYDIMINGEPKSEEKKQNDLLKHKEFMSKLNIKDGNIILLHTSPNKITDGYVGYGKKNTWTSNNAQGGIFFWATKERGKDASGGNYYYYCILPINEVYDGKNNPENYKNDMEALNNGYKVIVNEWKQGGINGGFAAYGFTKNPIKISFISYDGKTYNSTWGEI